jgi:AraC-like DNA-binding protein
MAIGAAGASSRRGLRELLSAALVPMATERRTPAEPELSARLIRPFVRLLRERGAPIESLAIRGGSLEDADTRVPHRLAIALLEVASGVTGDRALGLHAAEAVRPGDFDVLEYAAMSSATVGEGIATANRYLRLVHDAAEFSLDTDGTTAIWRFRLPAALALPPIAAEYFMAIFVVLGRRYAGRDDFEGSVVQFTHPRPADVTDHDRVFRAILRFDQPENALVLPAWVLALPMVKSDPALKTLLEVMAGEMLQKLPARDTLTAHVRRLLADELRGGDPGIEHLASKLHTTPRTLRRRLEEHGTTHRDILDELRKELAFRYLGQGALAASEVGFLLGYSSPSPFHRAFKRWAGMSVGEYRKQYPPRK